MIERLLPWMKPKAPVGRLAIQAGVSGMAHAEVSWRGERPVLHACMFRPGEAASSKAWAHYANAPLAASIVLDHGEYQLLPLDAPPVPPQELKMAVRWRIKDSIDYPVDEATVDILRFDPGASGADDKLLAVVARNALIKSHIVEAERAKIRLDVIDIPEMAQRNLAALLEPRDRVFALLSFTQQGGLLTLTRNGTLHFYRRIDFNLAALPGFDTERRHLALDRLALELQRSLDHIERQFSNLRVDRIILAPSTAGSDTTDYLRGQLYVPLEEADLTRALDGELPNAETLAACWFVLGAALRREVKVL
jgi:MSHA biogenesis protein MshI